MIHKEILFIVLLTIGAVLVVLRLIIPFAIVGWDESVFLIESYKIYQSIQSLNILEFLRITKLQFNYPPLQSWAIGGLLSLTGFSIENARRATLVWFVIGSFLVYSLAYKIAPRRKRLAGLLSSIFYLSSPMGLVFAGIALKETMGATLTILTILSYLRGRSLMVSVLVTTLIFTKYNYGILILIALWIDGALGKQFKKLVIISVLPAVATAFWVFFGANQFDRFMTILTNPTPWTQSAQTFDYLLFYPRSILYMYTFSPVLGYFIIASWILSLWRLGDRRIRILWISFTLNMILGTLHTGNMQERYIFTVLPFAYVLTGLELTRLVSIAISFARRSRMILATSAVVLAVLGIRIVIDMLALPTYVYAVGSYNAKFPQFNQWDYRDIWFAYDTSKWARDVPTLTDEKPSDVVNYVATSLDLTKPVSIVGRSNELAPDYFTLAFAMEREKNNFSRLPYPSYTVTVEVLPQSRYYTYDYKERNEWLLGEVRSIQYDPSFQLLEKKRFEQLGIEIRIYTP